MPRLLALALAFALGCAEEKKVTPPPAAADTAPPPAAKKGKNAMQME